MLKIVISLILVFQILKVNCEKLPDDIQLCNVEDTTCIVNVSNDLLRKFPNGRPDLKIPSIEPFFVKNLTLEFPGGNALDMKIKLNDINTYGLSKTTFDRVVGFTKDPRTSKFELFGFIPKLEFMGNYSASGRVLVLPVQGSGRFKITIKENKLAIKFKPKVYQKSDGLTYMSVEQLRFRLEPKSMHLNFENIFNGNDELSRSINEVMNENWKDIWAEAAATLYNVAEKLMKDISKGIFERFSYENIFL